MNTSKARVDTLNELLGQDFDFQGHPSATVTHAIHAFAAKFPPQLPAIFIERLTSPGDTVLDPMMGSGTTLIESSTRGRKAIGLDLDPLAIKQGKVKTTPIRDIDLLNRLAANIVVNAHEFLATPELDKKLCERFDEDTKDFVDYWFTDRTQRELTALLEAINLVTDSIEDQAHRRNIKEFFEVALSAIIVTKSGGVTKARDLAHGRAHISRGKNVKDAINQFRLRARKNIASLDTLPRIEPDDLTIRIGDARNMRDSVPDESVDLVVTSPPYANAIDYMRAHKFSLVWFGWSINDLSKLRSKYVGSERTAGWNGAAALPQGVRQTLDSLADTAPRQSRIVAKYLVEMGYVLSEMSRVLKSNRHAVIVVGPSTIKGQRIPTPEMLISIAESLDKPLHLAGTIQRRIDRDRRLLPTRRAGPTGSIIEQRMYEESIICLTSTGG